jgi:hypothetical protein
VAQSDAALGSLRLRGGIDANPRLLPGGRPSGFAGMDGVLAVGREAGTLQYGLIGEIERTEFTDRTIDPSERYRLGLEARTTAAGDWSLRSSSSIENTRSATVRSFDAVEHVRAQWDGGAVRPFLSAEIRYASLNETNAILTDFLPQDQRFGRVTLTPGATVKIGGAEFGMSASLSGTRYADRLDLFGFRRDNERIEPFLFGRYERQGLKLSASVSRLYGTWHDADFSNVSTTLYDVSLSKSAGAWTLDLGAKRAAAETTFPLSPITITSSQLAKLTFAPDERWSFGLLARALQTAYLDSPFSTDVLAYGATVSYALAKDWVLAAQVLRINSRALDGQPADGGVVSLSITKKFAAASQPSATQRQWAADRPPPIAPPNPVPGPSSQGVPYQPW